MWKRFKGWSLAAAAFLAFATPTRAEASKLGGVRSSVAGSSSSSSSGSSSWSSGSSSSSYSDGSVSSSKLGGVRSEVRGSGSARGSGTRVVGSFGTSTGVYAVGSPLAEGGHEGVHYDGHQHGIATAPAPGVPTVPRYRRHPYAERSEGYIVREPLHTRDSRGRIVAGQAAVEGAYAGDGVWRSGLQVRLAFSRLALDSNLSFYIDRDMTDAIYLGSTNLMFAPVLRPHVVWWVGGGANYLLDGRDPRQGGREYAMGYNVTSSLDVFPFSPFVLSGRVDAGTIHAARVLSARASVGVLLRGFELYGGYEAKQVGDVPLHGPMVGVRAWF